MRNGDGGQSEIRLSYSIESDGTGVQAVCTCGWASGATLNAGMAGSLWDSHASEAHARAE